MDELNGSEHKNKKLGVMVMYKDEYRFCSVTLLPPHYHTMKERFVLKRKT